MEASFHLVGTADLDVLLGFVRELYRLEHMPFDESGLKTAVQGMLDDPRHGRVWLIHDGDDPIGYAVLTLGYSFEFRGVDGFLDELYVRADRRGQGVGKAALRFVEDQARALGVTALHLEVEHENTIAQTAYLKGGFYHHPRYMMTKWLIDQGPSEP